MPFEARPLEPLGQVRLMVARIGLQLRLGQRQTKERQTALRRSELLVLQAVVLPIALKSQCASLVAHVMAGLREPQTAGHRATRARLALPVAIQLL
jgi:hypothetical protein